MELLGEENVVGMLELWVGLEYGLCTETSLLHETGVADNVSYMQVEGHAALLCAFKITWATEFQVFFGYLKAVGTLDHNLHATAGVVCQLALGD